MSLFQRKHRELKVTRLGSLSRTVMAAALDATDIPGADDGNKVRLCVPLSRSLALALFFCLHLSHTLTLILTLSHSHSLSVSVPSVFLSLSVLSLSPSLARSVRGVTGEGFGYPRIHSIYIHSVSLTALPPAPQSPTPFPFAPAFPPSRPHPHRFHSPIPSPYTPLSPSSTPPAPSLLRRSELCSKRLI